MLFWLLLESFLQHNVFFFVAVNAIFFAFLSMQNLCKCNFLLFPCLFWFIVNQPEGGGNQYIQVVRVVTCAGAGEECGWGDFKGRVTDVSVPKYK